MATNLEGDTTVLHHDLGRIRDLLLDVFGKHILTGGFVWAAFSPSDIIRCI